MKKLIYTLFVGMIAMGLSACKSGEAISTNPAGLQGDWQITAMNGQSVSSSSQNPYTISFNTDGTVAGIAACNRFAGTYSAQPEGVVSMNSISATKLDCDDSNAESYLDGVSSANAFQIKGGNQLVLTSSSGSTNIVFSKVVSGDEMMEDQMGS